MSKGNRNWYLRALALDRMKLKDLARQANKIHRRIKHKYWTLIGDARQCGGSSEFDRWW